MSLRPLLKKDVPEAREPPMSHDSPSLVQAQGNGPDNAAVFALCFDPGFSWIPLDKVSLTLSSKPAYQKTKASNRTDQSRGTASALHDVRMAAGLQKLMLCKLDVPSLHATVVTCPCRCC